MGYKKSVGRMLYFDFKGVYKHNTGPATAASVKKHWEAKIDDRYSNVLGRKRIYKTPEELAAKLESYFDSCEGIMYNKYGKPVLDMDGNPKRAVYRPYTISGLANAIGLSTYLLRHYLIMSQKKKIPPEYAVIITEARQKVEQYAEESLYDMGSQRGAQYVLQAGFKWNTAKEDIDIKAAKVRMKLATEEMKMKKELLGVDKDDSQITVTICRKESNETP